MKRFFLLSVFSAATLIPAMCQNGDPANGKKLFLRDGCYECHGYAGQGGAAGARNADIGYLPQRRVFDEATRVRGVDMVRLGLDGRRWGVPLPLASRFSIHSRMTAGFPDPRPEGVDLRKRSSATALMW